MSGSKSVAIFIAAFIFCGVAGFCARLNGFFFSASDVVHPVGRKLSITSKSVFVKAGTPPIISYPTPQSYIVNNTITPLLPVNSGGPVRNGIFDKVITLAGSGAGGAADGRGALASFNSPHGVAVDGSGNIYVADEATSVIRKIAPDGTVATFAGNGIPGSSNGTGVAASFHDPFDIAVDRAGNLFVADLKNQKIRKITPAGVVTDLAGNGLTGHDDGQNATFNSPAGVAIDKDGNLYVSDSGNNLVRKIAADGTVSTLAGSGSIGHADGAGAAASFNGPIGIAVDAAGNVFVADCYNHLIRKITPAGMVSTLAGSGTAGNTDGAGTAASFKDPIGLDIDAYGNLYVTDTQNDKIRKITPQGVVTSIAGKPDPGARDGNLASATFNTPFGIAIDSDGNLYIGDTNNNLIRKITVIKYAINKPLPPGLAFDNNTGKISGTPTTAWPLTNYTITAYNTDGSGVTHLSLEVKDNSVIPPPAAPDISYVTPQVYKVKKAIALLKPANKGGAVSGDYGASKVYNDTRLFAPTVITIDATGNVYVLDYYGVKIFKIAPDGSVTELPVNIADGATDMVADPAGNLYLTSGFHDQIWKIDASGTKSLYAGSGIRGYSDGPAAAARFNGPNGIVIDRDGNIFVGEGGNLRIRKITPGGMVSTLAGNGKQIVADGTGADASFFSPNGLTIDDLGNLYVADTYACIIRKITPAGEVTTYAGAGSPGSADGAASSATFYNPVKLASDSYGNIYVADAANQKIRKISASGIVSTLGDATAGAVAISKDGTSLFRILGENVATIGLSGYNIDKSLPPGLTFDPKTGEISGTPTAASPATDYNITGCNAGGSSTTTVSITVIDNASVIPPPVITYDTPNTYYINQSITPLPPKSTGSEIPALEFGLIVTYSGSGNPGYKEGGPTSVTYRQPVGVAVDASGNMYVADYLNHVIRKVDPAGNSSTLAGSGQSTFSDGKGANASFNRPAGIAINASGDLFVADSYNNRIRKITADGTVTTFAGSGSSGSANGTGAAASFNMPSGIAVDMAGYLYVADSGNNLIRKISPLGEVSTLAGNGTTGSQNGNRTSASFNAPQNLTVDAVGNIYVTDMGNNLIRKITPAGDVTTYAGNGSAGGANGAALQASFNKPAGIVVDDIGDLFISDFAGNLIRMIDPAGEVITLAGDGTSGGLNNTGTAASFNGPKGLALDANRKLYIADSFDNEIRTALTVGYRIDKPLPSGLSFSNATGIISGKPNVLSPLTNYPVTGYNVYGSSKTSVDIEVVNTQTISFSPIPQKIFCDKDFDPGATSQSQITYTSSDESVAKIVGNKIHIVGAGTTVITASDGISTFPQTLTVAPAVVPSLTITPSSADDCTGSVVTYKATPVNGGDSPHYQWLVNGLAAGTDNPVFTTGNLSNNDKITCVLTSSACTIGAKATSNQAVFVLDPPVITSVTITSSLTGPVCAGTEITFTALPSRPDLATAYRWQINSNEVGGNSATFTTKTLADGDVVTCIVISQAKCLVSPVVTSNAITIHFNPVSQCVISIPNMFTPNGDGINDFWNITALAYYPNCTVNVYSRYGSMVYKSRGYGTPWDGTSAGRTLPAGTYYYILDLKDGKKPMTGSITIIR